MIKIYSKAGVLLKEVDAKTLTEANLTGVNLAVVHLDRYTALVQSTHTRIGCQFRDNDYWRSASDEMISSMAGDALEWWTAYKPIIFATMAALEAKFPMKEEVA